MRSALIGLFFFNFFIVFRSYAATEFTVRFVDSKDKTQNLNIPLTLEPQEIVVFPESNGVYHFKSFHKSVSLRGENFELRNLKLKSGSGQKFKFYHMKTAIKDRLDGEDPPYFFPKNIKKQAIDFENGQKKEFNTFINPFLSSQSLPKTIRVGRRNASSCAGNPIKEIETIDFEEYVKGVVNAEVGVFTSIKNAPDKAIESLKTFAVAARTYAYYFTLKYSERDFDIDDTACNQRYLDQRNPVADRAVEETRGIILEPKADLKLGKYEYAASCGKHGTRPAYQDTLIADITSMRACVGSWCGHESCAAHEVNPLVPDEGRCLVRGICQWGSAERAMAGDDFTKILVHYQPNLTLRAGSQFRLVGFVRLNDISNKDEPIMSVRIKLYNEDLELLNETMTNSKGYFSIEVKETGNYILKASKKTYKVAERRILIDGSLNEIWSSFALEKANIAEKESDDVKSQSQAPDDSNDGFGDNVKQMNTKSESDNGGCAIYFKQQEKSLMPYLLILLVLSLLIINRNKKAEE